MDWEAFYSRFREPDFIPGYEIQHRLGGGAFGEVYKARKHSIGKAYAIKFLKIDDEAQKDAVERELEQVRHFAVIDHPNLVTIEDLGTALGVPYLVMGYAGEDTLARRLKQGGLEAKEALSFFVQACRGVVALHDRRLVHFDLKPSNVFLKGDVARVGDYGLSKMMVDGRLTLSFGRGTPQYMAPEMLRNRADHRADIYSLGVILYESLARKLPFESPVPGTFPMREDDRPPLFPPDFPAHLRGIVERCLRLSPDDRYDGVGDLLAEMGQTARPGDSVRWESNEVAQRGVPSASKARRDLSSRAPSGKVGESEARQTARELTRGAVEVARGVWDGILTGARRAETPHAPPSAQPATQASVAPPARASDGQGNVPPPVRGGDGEAREVLTLHGLSSTGTETTLTPTTSIMPAPAVPFGAMTIPVPPPVQGGWRGTLFSTFALAVEVLLALGRGLLGWLVQLFVRGRGGAASAGTGIAHGIARLFIGTLRLAVFVLVLLLLGGLTTFVAVSLLGGTR
jgi:serine/threonine-protein kinase